MWAKFKELVTDPTVFITFLRTQQTAQAERAADSSRQLDDIDGLIAEHTDGLETLVEKFARAARKGCALVEALRRQMDETEGIIEELKARRERLARKLAAKMLSDKDIQTIEELAAWARPLLSKAELNFAWRRRLIEAFDLRFTLEPRDGRRIVRIELLHWSIEAEVDPKTYYDEF